MDERDPGQGQEKPLTESLVEATRPLLGQTMRDGGYVPPVIRSIAPPVDPRLAEVAAVLAAAAGQGFVEVLVIGVLPTAPREAPRFTWFGSTQDVMRGIAMVEVVKRDMLNAMVPGAPPTKEGA